VTDSSPPPGPAPSPWRRPRSSDSGGPVQPPQPQPNAAPDDRRTDAPDNRGSEAPDDGRTDEERGDDRAAPHHVAEASRELELPFPELPGHAAPTITAAPAASDGADGDQTAVAQAFDQPAAGHRRVGGPAHGNAAREVSSTGLSPRVAGVLCYAAGWASGLVLLAMERQSPFVRFHAYQAVGAFGGLTVIAVTCWIVTILMAFISPGAFRVMAVVTQIAWIALGVTWLFVVVEVSQGKRRKLPWVGKRAERAAAALPEA
jgi:uncharacterized membrane protein